MRRQLNETWTTFILLVLMLTFFTFVGEIFLTSDLTKKQSWKHFNYVFDHHFYVVILDALYEYVVERKKEIKKKKKSATYFNFFKKKFDSQMMCHNLM